MKNEPVCRYLVLIQVGSVGEFGHGHDAGWVSEDGFEDEFTVFGYHGFGAGSVGGEAFDGATGVERCGDVGEGAIGGGDVGGVWELE